MRISCIARHALDRVVARAEIAAAVEPDRQAAANEAGGNRLLTTCDRQLATICYDWCSTATQFMFGELLFAPADDERTHGARGDRPNHACRKTSPRGSPRTRLLFRPDEVGVAASQQETRPFASRSTARSETHNFRAISICWRGCDTMMGSFWCQQKGPALLQALRKEVRLNI